jgi:hypothetical protein
MELYGGTASISQANALTQQAQQINLDNANFNNGLAEQLDQAILENNEDATAKMQKNITSGITSGGKLALSKDVRATVKKGILGVGKELPVTLREKMAKEGADKFVARRALAAAEERTGAAGLFADEDAFYAARAEAAREGGTIRDIGAAAAAGEETIAAVADESAEVVSNVAGRGAATTAIETSEGVVRGAAEKAVVESSEAVQAAKKTAEEAVEKVTESVSKAGKIAKVGIAGLGGGLDVLQDVGRVMKGEKGMDIFGSNNWSRVGNIGNIVGSALEVAGVATGGITPVGLALEGIGAVISLGSSVVEGVGDVKASEVTEEKATEDISSQTRGQVQTQQLTEAVGRTQ